MTYAPGMPPRVVSLSPAATEILAHIGGAGLLMGVMHDPITLQGPTAPRIAPVQLSSLRPDILIDIIEPDATPTMSHDAHRRVLRFSPRTVEEILDAHTRIGEAVELEREAMHAVVRLRERLFTAAERVNPYVDGPAVAVIVGSDPIRIGGDWIPQLVERAGAVHSLNPTVPSPRSGAAAGPQHAERRAGPDVEASETDFLRSLPEAVLIAPRRGDAATIVSDLARRSWWQDLPAVRKKRVSVLADPSVLTRPGPRVVEAFEQLVEWLNH